jgi:hypothetical protein
MGILDGAMSQEDVRVVRGTYDAFQSRDLHAFLSYMDPEVEFRSLVLEVEGVYHGHEGIRAWWENLPWRRRPLPRTRGARG